MLSAKILIVEDEPIVAMDLRQQIEECGYQVIGIAECADEALIAAEENHPDLALLDISIAGTMDGIQTAKFLRQWFSVPGIFVTAYNDRETIARAARQMPYGYLTKPIRPKELEATLLVALHKAQAEAREWEEHAEMITTVDTISDGLLLVSTDGKIRYMNAALETLTSLSLREAKEKSLDQVFQFKDNSGHLLKGLGHFDLGSTEVYGWRLQTVNGSEVPVDLTVTVAEDADGKPRATVFTIRDATERLRQQAFGEVQEEKPGFEATPMAMAQLDNAGRILRVNKALLNSTGVNAGQLLGRTLTSLSLDPDPRICQELMHKLLQEGTVLAAPHTPHMN